MVIAEQPDRSLFRSFQPVTEFSSTSWGGRQNDPSQGPIVVHGWILKGFVKFRSPFEKAQSCRCRRPIVGGAEGTSSLLGERAIFQWEQCGFVFERRRLSRQQEEWPLSSAFDAYDAFDFLTPTPIGRWRLPPRSLIRPAPRPSQTLPRPLTPHRRHQH